MNSKVNAILIKNNLIIQVVKIEKYIRKYGLFI